MDANGGVEAEAAGALPGEHVTDGVRLKEAMALEEAEYSALDHRGEGTGVVSGEVGAFVKPGLAVGLGEYAIEHYADRGQRRREQGP